jgi:hypothetical protein
MPAEERITIRAVELERIIAEAIGLAAWGATKQCAEQLWAGESPTLAGLDRAMGRARAANEALR